MKKQLEAKKKTLQAEKDLVAATSKKESQRQTVNLKQAMETAFHFNNYRLSWRGTWWKSSGMHKKSTWWPLLISHPHFGSSLMNMCWFEAKCPSIPAGNERTEATHQCSVCRNRERQFGMRFKDTFKLGLQQMEDVASWEDNMCARCCVDRQALWCMFQITVRLQLQYSVKVKSVTRFTGIMVFSAAMQQ